MKGVVFSTSFFIVIFAIFISLSNYLYFEHNRTMINNKFKKSLIELALHLDKHEDSNRNEVLQEFSSIIEDQLPDDFTYEAQLVGYHDDPLLIRIKLYSKSKVSNLNFELEETIIEKELHADEVINN